MGRPRKIVETDAKVEPVVNETDAIVAWLRSPKMAMFERSTRWLADRIEEKEHLK